MDNLQKGQNLSSTYVGLWMNLWDLPFLEIGNEDLMALEAGFSGIGATKRWKERMRSLEKWGFIVSKKDQTPEFRFVLIRHPHTVIEELEQDPNCKYEKETRTRLYEEMHLKENKYKGKGFYNQLLRNPPQSEGTGKDDNEQ